VVLDFRVEYAQSFDSERARAFVEGFPETFRLVTEVEEGDDETVGYVAYSEGDTRALQVGPWGFAFNEITVRSPRPYTSWEDIVTIARPLWERYVTELGVARVKRLGLRYSNVLRLDADPTGERKLLRSWPKFSESILRDPETYLLRMDVPLTDPGLRATVVHVLSHPETEPGPVQIVVDNDVYAPNLADEPSTVWETFERLRSAKNALFYDALTESALDRYR